MIIRDDDIYIITPVPKRHVGASKASDSHGAHIIYKRSALPSTHPELTQSCGVAGELIIRFDTCIELHEKRKLVTVCDSPESLLCLKQKDRSMRGWHLMQKAQYFNVIGVYQT